MAHLSFSILFYLIIVFSSSDY
uniref:Uncharacterized protein n=1 Tax=Arundo donax TaxID=35708 RepID=A0A0A9H902_ARUDO